MTLAAAWVPGVEIGQEIEQQTNQAAEHAAVLETKPLKIKTNKTRRNEFSIPCSGWVGSLRQLLL
jgi:hypothetical protein